MMKTPYDVTNYKITLPVDKNGKLSGKANEVLKLTNYQCLPYYRETVDGLLFYCTDTGATTPNAKYPRTELRDMREFGSDDNVEDKLKLKVLNCSEGLKIVVHQIHDDQAARVKVVWLQKKGVGKLYALVKINSKDVTVPLLEGIKNSQSVVSYLRYKNGKLTIKANSKLFTMDVNWVLDGAYFKRGLYLQSNANKGQSATVLHLKI